MENCFKCHQADPPDVVNKRSHTPDYQQIVKLHSLTDRHAQVRSLSMSPACTHPAREDALNRVGLQFPRHTTAHPPCVLPPESGSTIPTAGSLAVCDACTHCTDKCSLDNCLKCQIKLQNIEPSVLCGGTRRLFSICEVKRHNNSDSLWVCANNCVYDATPIIAWHPGGVKLLLKKVGFDCTPDFNFHSDRAKTNVWAPLKVGTVEPCALGTPQYLPPPRKSSMCRVM